MKTHEFTLIMKAVDVMTEELSNRLYDAGCDDGSPYSSQGSAGIRFHREADSLESAIRSAIADVQRAGVSVSQLVMDMDALSDLSSVAM